MKAEEKAPTPSTEIIFTLRNTAGSGDQMIIVGNHPALGSWDPAKGLQLRTTKASECYVRVVLEGAIVGNSLTYKYVHNTSGRFQWESTPNRVINIPADYRSVELFVVDRGFNTVGSCITQQKPPLA